jgi:hypothetical protein
MKKILASAALAIILGALVLTPALAQYAPGQAPSAQQPAVPITGEQSVSGWVQIFVTAVRWIYTILFILAVLFILLAAYNFVTSKGDPEKVSTARKQVLWAVIGVAVGLLAWTIVRLVETSIAGGLT